jgi:uncharacterized membrane protein YkoI
MKYALHLLSLGLPLALLAAAPMQGAHAAGTCTENWSEMAATVGANGLTPAKELQKRAKDHIDGKLVKVSLCQNGGSYQYELVILNPAGQVVTQTVDAKSPFPQ